MKAGPATWRAPWFLAILLSMLFAQVFDVQAAGFQRVQVPNPDGAAIELAVWFPSRATPARVAMGPVTQLVALGTTTPRARSPIPAMSSRR